MDIDQIGQELGSHSGTRLVEANGDTFAIYDPRGDLPPERQMPWATIVTSDAYDSASDLDRPGVFRLNLALPKARFRELVDPAVEYDATSLDVLLPHPVYAGQHWICVLNPQQSWPVARELLREAAAFAVRKYDNAEQRRARR
ncbi:DUF6194 family protein [Qaidamihabitans albus]|uniref:DUF6194 family protein n=1 Tax=Qaidamihabitans albus TaxID=2795733 RepID=UPI0018F10B7C|nr:DUF6194 family protein [Qaidamihabitans albus]